MRRRAGFTLVECLCVLAVSALVMAFLTQAVANSHTWAQLGAEESILRAQMVQSLDTIEHDVRAAKDIDVAYFQRNDNRPLDEIATAFELRLVTVDEGDAHRHGEVVYSLQLSDNDDFANNPPERPTVRRTLYRSQRDSVHSGKNEPLGMYLNSFNDSAKGFQVFFCNRAGVRCSLAEDVYSVEVHLAGTTKEGVVVRQSRSIPLAAKFD